MISGTAERVETKIVGALSLTSVMATFTTHVSRELESVTPTSKTNSRTLS